jgi:hypothetical protein
LIVTSRGDVAAAECSRNLLQLSTFRGSIEIELALLNGAIGRGWL